MPFSVLEAKPFDCLTQSCVSVLEVNKMYVVTPIYL